MNKLTISEETSTANVPALYEQNGSLAVSLARAEVDQQITTARAYPRSISRSVEHILTLATLDEASASECIYALKRDNKLIKGPSIRLAEIISSQWGNCRVGARVVHVDRFEKFIEAEGIFHDLETNTATTSRIRRRISTKTGGTFSEDMIVVTGNAACAIAKRNAILGGVPRGVWRKAYEAVEHVISGDVKTLVSRRRSVFATLAAEYKITADQIFAALEINGEDDIDLERLSLLTAMRASLKNGEATVQELFPIPQAKDAQPKTLGDKLDALAAGGDVDPPHDPETGEIISEEMRERAEEAADASNAELQNLLANGRAAATGGEAVFAKWWRRLDQKNADLMKPHLEMLRAGIQAAEADGSEA